jgi:DNA-binding CsgD family transcriptional regulator
LAVWASAVRERDPVTAEVTLPSGASIRATVSECVSSAGEPIGKAFLIRDVTKEKRVRVELSASVAKRLLEIAGREARRSPRPHLTGREREILQHLSAGMTNAAIATELNVSANTVATHLKHLYRKICVNRRSQEAAYDVVHGFLSTSA